MSASVVTPVGFDGLENKIALVRGVIAAAHLVHVDPEIRDMYQ